MGVFNLANKFLVPTGFVRRNAHPLLNELIINNFLQFLLDKSLSVALQSHTYTEKDCEKDQYRLEASQREDVALYAVWRRCG